MENNPRNISETLPNATNPQAVTRAYFIVVCLAPYALLLWALGEWGFWMFGTGLMAVFAGLGVTWRSVMRHYLQDPWKPMPFRPTLGQNLPIEAIIELGKWVFWIGVVADVVGVPVLTVLNGLYASEQSFIFSLMVIPFIIPVGGILIVLYSILQQRLRSVSAPGAGSVNTQESSK